jgi:hypothetical protein
MRRPWPTGAVAIKTNTCNLAAVEILYYFAGGLGLSEVKIYSK